MICDRWRLRLAKLIADESESAVTTGRDVGELELGATSEIPDCSISLDTTIHSSFENSQFQLRFAFCGETAGTPFELRGEPLAVT